ncbi:uncharacterized protein ACNS7B_013483 [Menidia menidia]
MFQVFGPRWPRGPQMFVPAPLRRKYPAIDCLEGLTWSLFFQEGERRRAPDYVPESSLHRPVWLQENPENPENPGDPGDTENPENPEASMKHIRTIQDLLVEIRHHAREEADSDQLYVLNECIYRVQRENLSVTLVGRFMLNGSSAEAEAFRRAFGAQRAESSLLELRGGLKASGFPDFCRQTFQLQQCSWNCERWGRYFLAAVLSASARNFRVFSLFLMSVIGCEVGRLRGAEGPLCTAFVGENHPMETGGDPPPPPPNGARGAGLLRLHAGGL